MILRNPKINEIIELKNKNENDKIKDFNLNKSIKFDRVSFKYSTVPKEYKFTFTNLTFNIPAGESTAIVGPSGLGKSTIVQMILRFYDPIEYNNNIGVISFDGLDIRKIQISELRENIGYVP